MGTTLLPPTAHTGSAATTASTQSDRPQLIDDVIPVGRRLVPAAAAVSLFLPLSDAWTNTDGSPSVGLAAVGLTAAVLVLVAMIASVQTVAGLRRLERWLLVLGCLTLVVLGAGTLLAQSSYPSDEAALTQGAAKVLLSGHDPYGANLTRSLWGFLTPGLIHTTQLLNGQFVHSYGYPSLPMLVVAPFILLTHDGQAVPIAYLFVLIAAMVLMFRTLPDPYRGLAVLLCAGLTLLLADGSNSGMTQTLAMAPLIYVAAHWTKVGMNRQPTREGRLSAVALGCAMAANQVVWFMVPFLLTGIYLIGSGHLGRRLGARVTGRYAGLALGTFLMLNLPFIIWGPARWLRGISEPLLQHAIPLGEGLVDVTLVGRMGGGDIAAFNCAAIALLAALLITYVLWFRRLGRACFILPILVLFISPRSLGSYWLLMIAVLVTSLAAEDRRAFAGASQGPSVLSDGRLRQSISMACFAPAGIFVALALLSPPPLRLAVTHLQSTRATGLVSRLTVSVTNTTNSGWQPHFTTSPVGAAGTMPFWRTVSGPATLAPGQTAQYVIAAGDASLSQPSGTTFMVQALTATPETLSSSAPVTAGTFDQ